MRLKPILAALSLTACAHPTPPADPAPAAVSAPERGNPLLTPSPLPLSMPTFDQLQDGDFAPAFERGMAEQRAEIDAIVNNPEPPSFQNTILALERSGALLQRVSNVFFGLSSAHATEAMQALEEELAPKLAAHMDAITLNTGLFARIDAVHAQIDALGLDPESAQLVKRVHADFARSGARLSDADKLTLSALNAELSTLGTQFQQTNRKAMTEGAVVISDVGELDGLSPEEIGAAAAAAAERGLDGKWVIALQNTTIQPVLSRLTNRAVRERVFRASTGRGSSGGPLDTTTIVARLVELRAQKAALLGYPNFASFALTDGSAKTPAAVDAMLDQLGAAALVKAKGEAAALQKIINAEAKAARAKPFTLEPWDWAYYAEKDRKARFAFEEAEVKPYFELNRVFRDGVFWSATQLYGLTFVERTDLPTYHPSVKVYEVRGADGSLLALFLLDVFQRETKSGGAWMNNYVDQSNLLGQRPVIGNHLNVPEPAPGQPVLLTFDEVTTAFHEFGHALHGIFADTQYASLSGTATPPDFTEFPSQQNEMWAAYPAVLANYAKHHETGEPMPKALFDKVIAAQNFGSGYATLEYVAAAKLDMAWHQIAPGAAPDASGVTAFEAAALERAGMAFAPVPPRYRTTYFNHVFAGGGYEAGYYAYIWSEVLARDTGVWFLENGGLSREAGDRYRSLILSRGRTQEPDALFAAFYGKAPDVGPLLDYRGLR